MARERNFVERCGILRENIIIQTVKPIRLTKHAREQCVERGATEAEVVEAIRTARVNRRKTDAKYSASISVLASTGTVTITPSNKLRPSSKTKPTK